MTKRCVARTHEEFYHALLNEMVPIISEGTTLYFERGTFLVFLSRDDNLVIYI